MQSHVDPLINLTAILVSILLMLASCWRAIRTRRPNIETSPAETPPTVRSRPRELPLEHGSADGTLLAVRRALSARPSAEPAPQRARPAGSPRRNRYRPTPWYRRPIVVASLTVVVLMGTVLSAGAWYAASLMSSLDDLSTPPPEIGGEIVDADADTVIDTGPAQAQVEQERMAVETPDATPVAPGSLTVLVMGVDARPGQPIDIQVRADSLAVVHIDPETGICRMLSIPRDTRVELPGYGYSKANHALAIGGVPYQQLVVEQYLGIEMDHYGLIDLAGVSRVVDAVGGITVDNLEYSFDINGHSFEVGTLDLSGEEAMAYAQYRGGPDGDYGRQERHQQIIRALLEKSAGLDILTALPDVLSAVRGHIRTDTNGRGLMDLAQTYRSTCTADSLETASLHGEVWNDWDDLSGQELSFIHVEDADMREGVAWLLGMSDEQEAISPASILGDEQASTGSPPVWAFGLPALQRAGIGTTLVSWLTPASAARAGTTPGHRQVGRHPQMERRRRDSDRR